MRFAFAEAGLFALLEMLILLYEHWLDVLKYEEEDCIMIGLSCVVLIL